MRYLVLVLALLLPACDMLTSDFSEIDPCRGVAKSLSASVEPSQGFVGDVVVVRFVALDSWERPLVASCEVGLSISVSDNLERLGKPSFAGTAIGLKKTGNGVIKGKFDGVEAVIVVKVFPK